MDVRWRHSGSEYLIHDAALDPAPEFWMLEAPVLRERGLVTAEGAGGRGQVLFFDPPIPGVGGLWVLRHFLRGGGVARVLGDRYLWTGLRRSRPWREFELMVRMRDEGLPVPRPVAARVQRVGACYRADLITVNVPDAKSLDQRLREAPVATGVWHRVGSTIRRFHDSGYCHADLNSRNILIDACERVWLLDWDRGRQRAPGSWQAGNLARLQRDLRKRARLLARWHYSELVFEQLRAGYFDSPVKGGQRD